MPAAAAPPVLEPSAAKRWVPRRLLVTKSALDREYGRAIVARAEALGCVVEYLAGDRLLGLRDADPQAEYVRAKTTLALVVASPGKFKLDAIPPSADWRVDLAEGCPAHCQYCYLAGSLAGPPIVRVYANLPEILERLRSYAGTGRITSASADRMHEGTTFECSCYTDPLALEHLTGGLARTIAFFGAWDADVGLRFTTKFDDVDPLLGLAHRGRTRVRLSVNAELVARRFEGGTASVRARLAALRKLALAGYRVGVTIAPIVAYDGWREGYAALFDAIATSVAGVPNLDLTAELITHRFTEGSKRVLVGWYPASKLDLDENGRTVKRNKFGGRKYVYKPTTMRELRTFFETELPARVPQMRILYWT